MSLGGTPETRFDVDVPLLIIGAGASGLVAALAAHDAGVDCVVLERDLVPSGSTALSSGMVPACGTQIQRDGHVQDSVKIMAADIMNKARGETDPSMVELMCRASGPAIDWLTQTHGVDLTLVTGFLYPGHSQLRMHAPPSRSGADLMAGLISAVERANIDIVCGAHVTQIFADDHARVRGVQLVRPDSTTELIGCSALILACNGFGGNSKMVQQYIPDMQNALYFGHPGNQGDAIRWGQALGAETQHLGSYQGHGSVAHPHGILISWALMMEGGVQVNADGIRFSNELDGYSEQARRVLRQPGSTAWTLFDGRLRSVVAGFEDFKQADAHGAVLQADTVAELAEKIDVPVAPLQATLMRIGQLAEDSSCDEFGRDFSMSPTLQPPYYAVKVTGALFHTQGGLKVDLSAQVLKADGQPLPNLFASGGAACGVSGPEDWGYLSGNGLLSAVTLGRLAGQSAAKLARPLPGM